MRLIIKLLSALALALPCTGAATAQSTCAQRYDDAKRNYDNGDRRTCITLIAVALDSCGHDREQRSRLLFLKALAEAGEDSLARMRSDLEQLYRNDRHYTVRAYDPLIKGKAGEADLYGAWEIMGSRMRRDHGRLRAGLALGPRNTLVNVDGDRRVFEPDGAWSYGTTLGLETTAQLEYDIAHNLAIRASCGWLQERYSARNNALRYEENISSTPIFLGLKKLFWLGQRSPWVPYAFAGASYAPVLRAEADIERSGDGVRFLAPKTIDRTAEREDALMSAGLGLGLSHKVGHVVLFAEAQYDHAFNALIPEEPRYSETELLIRYYYVDNEVSLSGITGRVGVHYVVKYHRKNRIHP